MKDSDLIRRSDVFGILESPDVPYNFEARLAVKNLPAVDAVEVVRCRECKYFESRTLHDTDIGDVGLMSCAAFGIGNIHPDDYCAWGKRREEEHNALD